MGTIAIAMGIIAMASGSVSRRSQAAGRRRGAGPISGGLLHNWVRETAGSRRWARTLVRVFWPTEGLGRDGQEKSAIATLCWWGRVSLFFFFLSSAGLLALLDPMISFWMPRHADRCATTKRGWCRAHSRAFCVVIHSRWWHHGWRTRSRRNRWPGARVREE